MTTTSSSTSIDKTQKVSLQVPTTTDVPPFFAGLHTSYIAGLAEKLDAKTSYEGAVTEHLRMSGVYWSLTALSLLKSPEEVDVIMGLTAPTAGRPISIVDWVLQCYDNRSGGFGGNIGHDGHLLYTLSAIQILALADRLQDERFLNLKESVIDFVAARQQPTDGSFTGDEWGEIDTRFTYCALSSLSILKALDRVNVTQAADFILSCRNFDGGFGCTIGAESHAGQVFTCVGALSIAKSLHKLDADLLGWWLAERQCDSGGLNGRPEKQADVCYSWWILSVLSITGRVSWINRDKLATFILKCQDDEDGGIADRPDDMADIFHTFFGISGLSLLGHLHAAIPECAPFRQIDPVYALPTDVVQKLGLQGQIMVAQEGDSVEERLQQYDTLTSQHKLFQ
ncbi:transferase type-2 subunit beta [Seminavis robusta]|uniref:Geranylgeranyl transferase type-2 subunit beta n=1 Tax=Seminavis robusta TaxID=568900 RepID=A0A9N8EPZ2_9STRA|nr:transferase type-2 subunit beta [Seminavis robusta]|eukprot:Sro1319_g262310.1 transferase type-2 subunit beta (397) ;mRNA; r:24187-25377